MDTSEGIEQLMFLQLVKAREIERKKAIAEGKMDDPLVPKRLDQAITMVGTCMDMCPRFERYRRERENNLDRWEVVRCLHLSRVLHPIFAYPCEDSRYQTRGPQTSCQDIRACCRRQDAAFRPTSSASPKGKRLTFDRSLAQRNNVR